MNRPERRLARIGGLMIVGVGGFLMLGAPTASAHPLGNFSINHSHNLSFGPHQIVDRAIVDFAEIPTAQADSRTDTDGDGQVTAVELAARARSECDDLRQHLTLTVDSDVVPFTVVETSFVYRPGQAGLPTGRLECRLEAAVDVSAQRSFSLSDDFASNRVGWHEINAVGDGVHLIDSPVPQASSTDELRSYPLELLDSPMNVRDLIVAVAPGAAGDNHAPAAAPDHEVSIFKGGPLAGVVNRITGRFNDLVGRRDLTVSVGLLAIVLAMILGASHALLPGHGKTVMAAYIAGRQGSSRDAVVVGATVTATHTGGVLVLGLALTVSGSLAGESVLGWLGVASGLIITSLGASLMFGAVRHRTANHAHSHRFGHSHHHSPITVSSPMRRHVVVRSHNSHGHDHDHENHDNVGSVLTLPAVTTKTAMVVRKRSAATHPAPARVSRRGLVGMGIAGGLVPSPSALIVLLSAIALGRTVFGIVLVIGYGLGMAATLTLAGLLLVRVRDRYQRKNRPGQGRLSSMARRWSVLAPYATATLVVVVGLGVALRGVSSVGG